MHISQALKRTYERMLSCEAAKDQPDEAKVLRLTIQIDAETERLCTARDAALKHVRDTAHEAWRLGHAALKEAGFAGNLDLHCAVSAEDVRLCLAKPGWPAKLRINFAGYRGDTPLHAACKRGFAETVTELLSSGSRLGDKNYEGQTAMNVAVFFKKADAIEAIRSHAARVVVRHFRDAVAIRKIKERVRTMLLCVRREKYPLQQDVALKIATMMYSGYARIVARLDVLLAEELYWKRKRDEAAENEDEDYDSE